MDLHGGLRQRRNQHRLGADRVHPILGRLRGRLRQVSSGYVLADLKRELRDFDMTKKEWKK